MTSENGQLTFTSAQDQSMTSEDCGNQHPGYAETLDFDNNAHIFAQLALQLAAVQNETSAQVG